MTIPIYKGEIDAGLAEIVSSNASVAYVTKATPFLPNQDEASLIRKTLYTGRPDSAVASEDINQWDLFFMRSVLASVGWNKNDDVFDHAEAFAARHTPVHKPFNFMHEESDIIGHMTSSVLVDQNGDILDEDKPLPDSYDIVVGSVLYKEWSDDALQERMDDILKGIAEGEWFVSMECLFRHFDYAVITPDENHKIIARNDETSFLTKHLRIYGGTGEYSGYKIGRLLRNFTFSGKGLVDNPANPRSIIFNNVESFVSSASLDSLEIPVIQKAENNNMENEIITQLRSDLAGVKEALATSDSRVEKMVAEAREQSDKEHAVALEVAKTEADVLKSDVTSRDETVASLTEKVEALEADVVAKEVELTEANDKLEAVRVEAITAARITSLVEAGLSSEDAAPIVEKWASASDEMFADMVALHGKNPFAKDDDEDEDEDKDAKAEEADADIDVDENEGTADASVEDAELDAEPNLSVSEASNQDDELIKATSAWLGDVVLKNGKVN